MSATTRIYFCLFGYGGLAEETIDCLIGALIETSRSGCSLKFTRAVGDALISRSRSKAMSAFLDSDAHVLFTVDHDIVFPPEALVGLCRLALDANGIVSGLYANRGDGQGISARLSEGEEIQLGSNKLVQAVYAPAGFTAYPMAVVEGMLRRFGPDSHSIEPDLRLSLCRYLDGSTFYDFFRPFVVRNEVHGCNEYLSEDWAVCARARAAGFNSYVWPKPTLIHMGRRGYKVEGNNDGATTTADQEANG